MSVRKIGRSARARLKEQQAKKLGEQLALRERRRLRSKIVKARNPKPEKSSELVVPNATGGQQYSFPIQPGEKAGRCACGCGKKTTMILGGDSAHGYWCSGYRRFVNGHQWTLRNKVLNRPADYQSPFQINRERDRLRIEMAAKARNLKVPTFDSLKSTMGKIEIFGRPLPNSSIAVILGNAQRFLGLDYEIPRLVTVKKIQRPVLPISEFYPYAGTGNDELIAFVQSIIPEYVYNNARSEISQEVLLALISGELQRENAKREIPNFIKRYYSKFGRRWDMVSFDQATGEDEGRDLHGILQASPSFEYFAHNKTPLEMLMAKEEWEEREKYKRFSRAKYGRRLTTTIEEAITASTK